MDFWLFFIIAAVIVWLTLHFYTIYTHLSDFPTSPFVPFFGHICDYVDHHIKNSTLYIQFFIIAAVIVWLTLHFYTIYTHLSDFPTSPFVPFFGHICDYVDHHNALKIVTNNVVKYGGIIRQFIGPQKPSLMVANKDFLQFLCSNSKYVGKAKFYNYMKPWLGDGLITSDGAKWLSRRKALTSCFTQTSALTSFVEIFEEKSDILIGIFDNLQNKNINLHPIMKRFTLDVICETAMGVNLDSQLTETDSAYARSIETICGIIQARMTSFLKSFDFFFQFSNDCVREKTGIAVVDTWLRKIIEKKREEKLKKGKENIRKDMLDLLMEVEIDGKALNSSDLREEINTFTFAGYDTTSSALSLALYEIAENPDIQAKLFEEQMKIFKEDINPSVTFEKLHEMSYLDMVVKETLRLHTIVPFVGKRVTKDLNYEGKLIPSMLNISIFIHGFHHNPNYFPEPDQFDPERFSQGSKIENFTYIPFGVKPRQCLGKNFAMLEMKCALSKIIRNFEIIRIPEHQLKIVPKLVLFSSSGIWVTVKRRDKKVATKNKLETTEQNIL